MKGWYVVGTEPAEGDHYVNVFGPFVSETDARAYALDEAEEEWSSIEARQLEPREAEQIATDKVFWPYDSEPIHPESGEED